MNRGKNVDREVVHENTNYFLAAFVNLKIGDVIAIKAKHYQ